MNAPDPHGLLRFVSAQADNYENALRELRAGKKESHWIWFIFPQVAGLGSSPTARHYAIRNRDEAAAYLAHDILGPHLDECAGALLARADKNIDAIMGFPDNLKLQSSMTLFDTISPQGNIFRQVLDRFFGGRPDEKTLAFLER